MSFEAEVIPLFIGGVIAVSAIEFFLGWRSLRHRKDLRGLFAGHVVAMLLGFFFLIRSLFANWLGLSLGIASISNSVNIGLFGLCWAVSAAYRLRVKRNGRKEQLVKCGFAPPIFIGLP